MEIFVVGEHLADQGRMAESNLGATHPTRQASLHFLL